MNIETLNKKYKPLDYQDRIIKLFEDFSSKDILFTSSFGTTAGILLYLIHKTMPNHPIFTIDTGYLFKETHLYIKTMKERWNLNIQYIRSEDNHQLFTKRNKTYINNQDLCCEINKVIPLQNVKSKHKIWVSGLLAFQNKNRKSKHIFEEKNGIIKCYPIIDLPQELANTFMIINEIPQHPLVDEGYHSIGCTHCTHKGERREGRWSGTSKIECGIHTS